MPDSIFRLALCRRLHMPVLTLLSPSSDVDSIACGATCQRSNNICGARLDSALLHPLICTNGGGHVFSHERVNDVLTEIAQDTYGKNCATNKRKEIQASLGIRYLDPDEGRKVVPDGLVRTFPRHYWDVTIVAAHAPSVSIHCPTPGAPNRSVEKKKRRKYAPMFDNMLLLPAHYHTFAIEHGGRLGSEAHALLRMFALHQQDRLGQPTDRILGSGKTFLRRWIQCISVAFQYAQSLRVQAAIDRLHTGFGSVFHVHDRRPSYRASLLAAQRMITVY
jgi:hypothetical protein